MKTDAPKSPIATSLVRAMRAANGPKYAKRQEFRDGAAVAAELLKSNASSKDLDDLHPLHALYLEVHNHISVMAEHMTALPEVGALADLIEAAEEEYMPSGPPMSPLTNSYFSCWSLFDAAVGPERETLGTCALAVAKALDLPQNFSAVAQILQNSSMRVYVDEGESSGRTVLRDLLSGKSSPCIVPSAWRGRRGDLWLARILPGLGSLSMDSLVFTTPYILRRESEKDWLTYLNRTLGPAKADPDQANVILKHGINWSEYIFAGYANFVKEAVFLVGLPDVPGSLPHYSPRKS